MGHPPLSRTRLFLILMAGAAAGALSMSLVPLILVAEEHTAQGFLDAGLWGLWLLACTVPIAMLVGIPAFGILGNRGLLSPASVCITGLLAGLPTKALMYGISGQSVPLGFLILGGFGGLGPAQCAAC